MKISTRGRYALRVMIDLAEHDNGDYVVLMDMAQRQGLSEKYLESIVGTLSRGGFVLAQRGRGGGYRLAREPENYTVGSILRQVEGPLVPVSCLEEEENPCCRADDCRTLPVWTGLSQVVNNYLDSLSLADLLRDKPARTV